MNADFPSGTILITGGVSGIGLATAEVLLQEGADRCALIDLNPPSPGLVEGLEAKFGAGRARAFQCNVAARDDVAATVAAVAAESPIAGLVNCAGVLLAKPSLDLTLDDLHRLFDIHVGGSLFTAQSAVRHWTEAGVSGAIVNVSSIAAAFGSPGRLPYSVAKTGIEAVTRTLAVEWARWNIRVNAVAPGSVDSPMMADGKRPPGIRSLSEAADRNALGRVGATAEIGQAIAFLLSSKSSFMTGAVVPVDGGFTITKDSAKELAQ